jgi:ankyrin repeat protein
MDLPIANPVVGDITNNQPENQQEEVQNGIGLVQNDRHGVQHEQHVQGDQNDQHGEETQHQNNDEIGAGIETAVIINSDQGENTDDDDDDDDNNELQEFYHTFEMPAREEINTYNLDGYTPIQRAVQTRFSINTIEQLLNLGADLTLFTKAKARPVFNPNGFINLQFQRFAGDNNNGNGNQNEPQPPQQINGAGNQGNNNNTGVHSHEPNYETSIFHLLIDSQYFNLKSFKYLLSKIPQKGQKDQNGKITKKDYKIDSFTEKHTSLSLIMKLLSKPDQQVNALRILFGTFDNDGNEKNYQRDLFNKKKVDLNATDSDGNTALHLAILYKQSVDIIEFLIQNGADIDVRNAHNTGQTPFFMSLGSKQWDSARLLIKYGCDINQGDKFGRCPLHVAIKTHDSPDDFLIMMLDHPKIDANYLTIAKRNALMEATEFSRSTQVLKKLIYTMEKQNNSNFLTKYFKIYQSYESFEENYTNMSSNLITTAEPDRNTPSPPNSPKGGNTNTKVGVQNDKNDKNDKNDNLIINATDSGGMSAIHFACSGYHINENTLGVLLATPGINTNKLTFSNWNALTFALRSRHPNTNIIKLLLDHGCDPNTIDDDLHDPFVIAIQYDCRKSVIELLLKKTNIFKLYDKKGYTILMFVILKGILRPRVDISQHDTDEVFEMLIEHIVECIINRTDAIDAVTFAQQNIKEGVCDDF